MNCFQNSASMTSGTEKDHSILHHLGEHLGKVASGVLIRQCLREISPDDPERGLAAARVMQGALLEICRQESVKQSLAEFYGIHYLLTSLTQAIEAYETKGRVDELMFVAMRIGRELSTYRSQVSLH